MSATVLDPQAVVDTAPTTEPSENAHVVKVEPGENAAQIVFDAMLNRTPVEALCGYVWVPSRDPQPLPVCQRCADIYEMYRVVGGNTANPGDAFRGGAA